jgi:hypothetical protein
MRVRRVAALTAGFTIVGIAACSSPPGGVASPVAPVAPVAPASPASPADPPQAASSAAAGVAAASAASTTEASGGTVHQVTLNRTTDDGYSYRISVSVELGTPYQDPTEADPGTTDIVLPISLLNGTLTNTTPGGHDLPTSVDNITGLSLFIGPALPKTSSTCGLVTTSMAFIDIVDLSPYAGCGRMVDNLQPSDDTGEGASPVDIPSGQSLPLTLEEGDLENRPGDVTVNVPQASADKITADFASAEVCVLLSPSSGANADDYTAGSCA